VLELSILPTGGSLITWVYVAYAYVSLVGLSYWTVRCYSKVAVSACYYLIFMCLLHFGTVSARVPTCAFKTQHK
jgi:hypothetical protein